jgi:formyl-CoA transferase
MSALYHRDALGGEAQEVDAALYESMFRLLENIITPYQRLGLIRERSGNQLGASVPAGVYDTADGKMMVLTTSTDRTFRRLAALMEREDMISDPRYATNRARVERRAEVDAIVGDWFGSRGAKEIQRLCDANGVPVSPVNNIADIFEDEHFAAREMLVEVEHTTLGKVAVPGIVPKFSKTPGEIRHAGPELGEHNEEVYGELGLDKEELFRLREEGVI